MAQSDSASAQRRVTRSVARRFPTLNHVWIFTAVALLALRPLLTPIQPHDFWWHMATGRLIVQNGFIPQIDQFSYTQAGQAFYNQGWLAQVVMYGLHSLGGVPLLLVTQAVVIAFAYGLLLRLCLKRSGAVRLSVGLLLLTTMPLSFDNWNVRPQSYAFPIFVAFLYILTMWRLRTGDDSPDKQPTTGAKAKLWLLPLLMIVWVNLHGSFVLGGVLLALTFVGEWARRFVEDRRKATRRAVRPGDAAEEALRQSEHAARPPLAPLALWGAVTAVAVFVNPRGIAVLDYVRNLLSSSAVTDLVTEWAPPTIRDTGGMIFFLFLLFCIVVLAYTRRPDPVDLLLVGAFLWLALSGVRHIVWFGMVATPLLVVQTATWLQPKRGAAGRSFDGLPALNAVLMGLVALLLFLGLPWIKPALDLPPTIGTLLAPETPVAAAEQLIADPQPPDRLFNELGYGSYLIWAAPQQPVFIDPRIELYPYEQWQDYIRLNRGEQIADVIDKYRIDGLLLDKERQAHLIKRVRVDPAWEVRFEDDHSVYLVKRER